MLYHIADGPSVCIAGRGELTCAGVEEEADIASLSGVSVSRERWDLTHLTPGTREASDGGN